MGKCGGKELFLLILNLGQKYLIGEKLGGSDDK